MKTTICLVRHGMTDWNKKLLIQGRKDIPLNDDGKRQVQETAKRLKEYGINFDVFLSSPLSRSYDTCTIIKNTLGYQDKEILIRANLTEREFGKADGLTINDDVYEKVLNDEYEGMEKSYIIQDRAKKEILSIAKLYEGKTILIVSHSHFIKALFTTLDNNLTFKSRLANGSLNFVEIDDQKIINFTFNK